MKVSYYETVGNKPTVKNIHNGTEKQFNVILNNIQKGIYKTQIEALRKLQGDDYKKQKNYLPAFTPSGTFTERKTSGIKKHSGILSIDIDGLNNPKELQAAKENICADKFVLSVFISPSGTGLKVFIRIDETKHAECFTALQNYYESEYGLVIDKACKDISRLCFVSYDKETYINLNAEQYQLQEMPGEKTTDQLLYEVNVITERIEAEKIDITDGYKQWLKLGFALGTLGENGRSIFHRISKFYNGYNEAEANNQFSHCLKPREAGTSIKTFFFLAKSKGVDVHVEVAAPILTTNKNTEKKYGTEKSDVERICNAMNKLYNIRFNSIRECVEISEKDSTEYKEVEPVDIWYELSIRRVKGASKRMVENLLQTKFVKKYNPYIEYFESLMTYDKNKEPDYIQLLCDKVKLKDEAKDRHRFNTQFKKALVRSIACSVWNNGNDNKNFNKHCLVFINPEHSIGKSSFVRYLVPKKLDLYFSEKMQFDGSREEDYTMQSSFIINIDELADINEKNLNIVKTAMSRSLINVRRMNTSRRLQDARRCNFFATTNETTFLKDDTGSARWICFEIDSFEKNYWIEDNHNYIDINKVWAQAYDLYKTGFQYQLSYAELQENETANDNYKTVNVEADLINSYFVPGPEDKLHLKTTTDIKLMLCKKVPFIANSLNLNKLGAALIKQGFKKGSVRTNNYPVKGYFVKERA